MTRRKKKSDSLVHYAVHKKDRQAWGAPTLCGKKRVSASFNLEKVTCTKCMAHTNWGPEQYKAACRDPLVLCPDCDRGELKVVTGDQLGYVIACTNCDHSERRLYGSLTI